MTTRVDRFEATTRIAIALGLVLYAVGTAVMFADEPIFALGLDRAKVQGAIAIPTLLLAPAVLSLAWLPAGRAPMARLVLVAMVLAITIGRTVTVASSVTQVGCQPVTPPFGALPQAIVPGLAAGIAFAVSVAAGTRFATAGRPIAAVITGATTAAATYAIQVALLVAMFPGVSCAPR